MSDLGDTFKALNRERADKHAQNYSGNIDKLMDTGLKWRFPDRSCMTLRPPDAALRIDFYPHTGRWKDVDRNTYHTGGADAFLTWYSNRNKTQSSGTNGPVCNNSDGQREAGIQIRIQQSADGGSESNGGSEVARIRQDEPSQNLVSNELF